MRIGVIGSGIVGTTIAASLKRFLNDKVDITVIDDLRDHQTSQAG